MASTLNIPVAGQPSPSSSQIEIHAQTQSADLQGQTGGTARDAPSTRIYSAGILDSTTVTLNSSILGDVPLDRPLTSAEKAREKKLREDPYVESLTHLHVICKLCKSNIKLSPKSTFDPFHWSKHRERCLAKREGGKGAPKGRKKKTKGPLQNFANVKQLMAKKITRSSKSGLYAITPPITTDDDDDTSSQGQFTWGSPSPTSEGASSSRSITTLVHQPNLEFEDYLTRSQRHSDPHLNPKPRNWKNWSWTDLKAPVYDVKLHHILSDDDGDDEQNDEVDSDIAVLKPKENPTCTLSFITESGQLPPDHNPA